MIGMPKSFFIFLVDTDKYAGNFERAMCAYLTKRVGECEVGRDYVAIATPDKNIDEEFEGIVLQLADDRGCHRPCSMMQTAGYLSNFQDGCLKESDWNQEEMDKAYREMRVRDFTREKESFLRTPIADLDKAGWADKAITNKIKNMDKQIEQAKKEPAYKYTPFNTVAIFFEQRPTPEAIELLKKRALEFPEVYKKKMIETYGAYGASVKTNDLNIIGFRLQSSKTTITDEAF